MVSNVANPSLAPYSTDRRRQEILPRRNPFSCSRRFHDIPTSIRITRRLNKRIVRVVYHIDVMTSEYCPPAHNPFTAAYSSRYFAASKVGVIWLMPSTIYQAEQIDCRISIVDIAPYPRAVSMATLPPDSFGELRAPALELAVGMDFVEAASSEESVEMIPAETCALVSAADRDQPGTEGGVSSTQPQVVPIHNSSVASGPEVLPAPSLCVKCSNTAAYFAFEPQAYACEPCMNALMVDDPGGGYMAVAEYRALLQDLQDTGLPANLTSARHNLQSSTFLECSTSAPYDIVVGQQFLALDRSEMWLGVGFVGPSGVGKSRIIRSLLYPAALSTVGTSPDGFTSSPRPIVGAPAEFTSTTSGMHGYLAPLQPHLLGPALEVGIPPARFMMLDCEGSGGAAVPLTASIGAGVSSRVEELFKKKHSEYVKHAYPRFLYLFCNTLCFVFEGDPRQVGTFLQQVIEYAAVASAHSTKSETKPNLVLIFNKQPRDAILSDSCEVCANKFFDLDGASDALKSQVKSMYDRLRVVYLPMINAVNIPLYLSQIGRLNAALHALMAARLVPATPLLLQVDVVFPMMSQALRLLTREPTNPLDMYLLQAPKVVEELGDLVSRYFDVVLAHFQEYFPSVAAHSHACDHVIARLGDTYLTWIHRNIHQGFIPNVGTADAMVHKSFATGLLALSKRMNDTIPCSAEHTFPGMDRPVRCEEHGMSHRFGHRSSEVYSVAGTGFVESAFQWLGLLSTPTMPCHWRGNLVGHAEYEAVAACNDAIRGMDATVLTHNNLLIAHHAAFTHHRALLNNIKTTDVCVGCLTDCPVHRFNTCGHSFCKACCDGFHEMGLTACPIDGCHAEFPERDLPRGAGYRVLSMDGGGVRGIAPAFLLRELEQATGFTSAQLFDYVIGTSVGGIIALRLFAGGKQGPATSACDDLKPMMRDAFQHNFLKKFASLFRAAWYRQAALRKVLCKEINSTSAPLFGSRCNLPMLAVTGTRIDAGKPHLELLTSYRLPLQPDSRTSDSPMLELDTSMVDAALATSAARPYFPHVQLGNKIFLDGGFLENNPCMVGWHQAKLLWSDRRMDVIVTAGTGILPASAATRSASLLQLLDMLVDLAVESNKRHVELTNLLHQLEPQYVEQTLFRFDPPYSQPYKLDATQHLDAIIDETERFLGGSASAQVLAAATRLTATMFYLEPLHAHGFILERTPSGGVFCRARLRSRGPITHTGHLDMITSGTAFTAGYILDGEEHGAILEAHWESHTTAKGNFQVEATITGLPLPSSGGIVRIWVRSHLPCARAMSGIAAPAHTHSGQLISGMPADALFDILVPHSA
jgi:hypothetical protein